MCGVRGGIRLRILPDVRAEDGGVKMAESIDRDELYTQICKKVNNPAIRSWLGAILAEFPAADVAPVKHGKWNKKTVSSGRESWEWPLCHRRARGKEKNLPYCHCGAKMDLEG